MEEFPGVETTTVLPETSDSIHLKSLSLDCNQKSAAAIHEINILLKCASPFVVRLRHVVYQKEQQMVTLVMLNEGIDLREILLKQSGSKLDDATKIMADVVSCLCYIHNKLNICHRDLKPSNILISPSTGQLRLADFGFATDATRMLSGAVGSPGFIAPEMMLSEFYDGRASDIWSCGVLYAECILGSEIFEEHWMRQGPFSPDSMQRESGAFQVRMLRALRHLRDLERRDNCYSADIGRIFRRTVVLQPKRRCNAQELSEELRIMLHDEDGDKDGDNVVTH